MSTETEPLIFAAIAAAMNDIEAIGKNKQNSAQKFYFRGIDAVYNSLHPIFAKNQIFTIPEVLEDRQEIRSTRDGGGTLIFRVLKIKYTCYAKDGSSVSGVVLGEAMDTGDKSANKAMSIAHKYFLIQLFAIPTEDIADPDADTHLIPPVEKLVDRYTDKFLCQKLICDIEATTSLDELKEVYTVAYNSIIDTRAKSVITEAKDKRKGFLLNQLAHFGQQDTIGE